MRLQLAILLCLEWMGSMARAQENPCLLAPDPGPCEAAIPAWYFDPVFQSCTVFSWGGCGGVVPFETLEDCEAAGCGDGNGGLSGLCDSIVVTPMVIGDATLGHLEVEVNAFYETDHWFGYAGFALFDASGELVAAEDVATAPNAFGFDGNLGPHTRYLEYQPGVDLSTWTSPFSLELRLYEGWMAGLPTERCAWTWTEFATPSGMESAPDIAEGDSPVEWFDVLGRPAAPTPGRWLLRRKGHLVTRVVISE